MSKNLLANQSGLHHTEPTVFHCMTGEMRESSKRKQWELKMRRLKKTTTKKKESFLTITPTLLKPN